MAGIKPIEDIGARAPDVQKAGGRRRKPDSKHGNASITRRIRRFVRLIELRVFERIQGLLGHQQNVGPARKLADAGNCSLRSIRAIGHF